MAAIFLADASELLLRSFEGHLFIYLMLGGHLKI